MLGNEATVEKSKRLRHRMVSKPGSGRRELMKVGQNLFGAKVRFLLTALKLLLSQHRFKFLPDRREETHDLPCVVAKFQWLLQIE